MPASVSQVASAAWHASADTIVATIAGGLAVLVFYPITLCAAGVKGLLRAMRPHLVSNRGGDSVTSTN